MWFSRSGFNGMDPVTRNAWLMGGGGVICAAAFGILLYQAGVFSPSKPAPAPPAVAEAKSPQPEPQTKPAPSAPPAMQQVSPAILPSFDVVRVEPNGEAVIAGRAAPGAKVTLMISGKPGGQAGADREGQFVILPQALPPGSHDLSLQSEGPQGALVSKQTVAVSVPARPSGQPTGEVVVALAEPDKPTRVLSAPPPAPAASIPAPAPAAAAPTAPAPASPAPVVAAGAAAVPAAPAMHIESVEADEAGGFYASGLAAPGAQVRLYLNGSFLTDVIADAKGRWSLRVSRGLQRGKYTVRADALAAGKVAERAQVEFDYAPAPKLAAAPEQPAAQPQGKAATTVGAPAAVVASAPVSAPVPAATPAPSDPVQPQSVQATPAASAAPVSQPAPAQSPPAQPPQAHVVIEQLRTASVVRGDSLWRISRRMLGQGVRYTQIYAANSSQVRNPHRIYPGQVLVVPNAQQPPAAKGGG